MCNTLHIKFNTGCYSYIASISTKSFSLQLATLAYTWTTYIGSINCIKILIVLSPIFPCLVICKGSATVCLLLHGSYNSVWLHKHIRGFQKGASNGTYRIHFKWHGGLHWDTDADEMYMHAHGLNYMWLYNEISHISIQYTPYKYVCSYI